MERIRVRLYGPLLLQFNDCLNASQKLTSVLFAIIIGVIKEETKPSYVSISPIFETTIENVSRTGPERYCSSNIKIPKILIITGILGIREW
ncbi:14287_t:CDS:2 [Dentiscutata erythropus]|uniref:14287_t:CDS:1 n=1 Tax=Dentiscutata erythropus TaxID=1348616 RepID=A0A9N9BBQ4_9GLOM|nr:14287_t:CDS:2 [Dentiscutata erythropus]